ncbi:SGNH/GDSL hydrolase family protein [Spirillospora sp. CA-294931]|uniref:SGNH/GDSL hydrolase family protein n=1 Tax=Spirillospora sp. CA-294931 TaxID=3240042 RepID=UPI003D89D507
MMRVTRARTLALGTIAAVASSIALAAPASAADVNYVALGDSYASGVGAGPYDSASGDCRRSNNAYPKLWAASHTTASFKFVACSGATTVDVKNSQLSALSSNTTLVSVTAGGNDAGFARTMETCVLRSTTDCKNAAAAAETFMRDRLPGLLDSMYSAIKQKSPSARVVALGYPRLYKIVSFCVGIGNEKRTALNQAADTLSATIGKAAANAGVTYSDVRDEFAGHELCSGHDWLNAVTIPINDSYHPTALGHRSGYLPALNGSTSRVALARSGR